MNNVDQIKKHLKESSKQWSMAWSGNEQNDSPAGRLHFEQAMNIFRSMGEDERAELPHDILSELTQAEEQENIAGDALQ